MKPPSPATTMGRLPLANPTPNAQPVSWPSDPQAAYATNESGGNAKRFPKTQSEVLSPRTSTELFDSDDSTKWPPSIS